MVDSQTETTKTTRPVDPDRYSWVRTAMPRVAQLVGDKRREYGPGHVAECWRRGMAGEPGWFFAREGAVAIGTPWTAEQDPVLAAATAWQFTGDQAAVFMRKPVAIKEVSDGA